MGCSDLYNCSVIRHRVLRHHQQALVLICWCMHALNVCSRCFVFCTIAIQFCKHFYLIMPNASSYAAAQQTAAQMTYNGWPAYLATIHSFNEYQFLSWLLHTLNAYVSASDGTNKGNWVLLQSSSSCMKLEHRDQRLCQKFTHSWALITKKSEFSPHV